MSQNPQAAQIAPKTEPLPESRLAEPEVVIGNLYDKPARRRKTVPALFGIAAAALAIGFSVAGAVFLYESREMRSIPGPPPAAAAAADADARIGATTPLATGADLLPPRVPAGAGKFWISNKSGQDAVVRVAKQKRPADPLRLIYVRRATDVTIGGIGAGNYLVSFSVGPLTDRPRAFGPALGPFTFEVMQGQAEGKSQVYNLTIQAPK
jgi:hypothetical protein